LCTDSTAENQTHSGPPLEVDHGAVHPGHLPEANREHRSSSHPRKANDHRRFENQVIPHTTFLLRGAQALTKQRADAEELLQDTMLKAYLSLGTFREGSNMKAWLYRIMLNTWVDKYRQTQRRPAEQLSGDIADFDKATDYALIRNCSQSAEVEMMLTCLATLCRHCRPCPPNFEWPCTTPTSTATATPRSRTCWQFLSERWRPGCIGPGATFARCFSVGVLPDDSSTTSPGLPSSIDAR